MVIKYFENHTLFCRNKLYKKTDAQVVPKNKNKIRAIISSNQFIENKNKIYYCLNVIIYSCKNKTLELLLWNSFGKLLFCKEQT